MNKARNGLYVIESVTHSIHSKMQIHSVTKHFVAQRCKHSAVAQNYFHCQNRAITNIFPVSQAKILRLKSMFELS